MGAQKINTAGFLSEFLRRHELLPDRPFCWVLGSGASFQSGIPTGGALAKKWLEELHEMEDLENQPIEKWATAKNLGIKNFDFKNAATFYPWIYWRRFRKFREEGYAFLEKVMEDIEPSYGYSVLAQIMAEKQHKAAVTTNFDNLIADALAIYTRALPLVCGHESLTGFIRPNLQRPLIAKIHRDLLLNPKNEPGELEELPKEWINALTTIFANYTPIVIGYGGNDGSLMGLLKSLPPIKGGIFWCYRIGDEPDARIHEIIEHHDGSLVPIFGFDELMLQLAEKLKIPDPRPVLQKVHTERVTAWQKQFEELNKKLKQPGETKVAEAELKEVRAAADAAVERLTKEKGWWAWQLKANAEPDPKKAEAIYRDGLKDFPESTELAGNFANFMKEIRKDFDEAERFYRKALKLDPKNASNTGNFAVFMEGVRKDYDEAERLYRKALEFDPKSANHTGNFANFIEEVRKDCDEAERLYRKALELDPKHANNTGNFANFMGNVRKDYDEAERLYRKALELDPKHVNNTGNFANFMKDVRKNYDEAERFYRKALELDPKHANNTGNFANFMERVRKDYDEAERLHRKALELDPNSAGRMNGLAWFLAETRKNYQVAETLARKAVELAPNVGNYADTLAYILWKSGKDFTEANKLFKRALELEPENEEIKQHYPDFLKEHPEFAK
jgi:tetratricopeptide (TPR) repeat protein